MQILLALLFLLVPAVAGADFRVEGRVFTPEGALAGARVEVYRSAAELAAGLPYRTSAPTDALGLYALTLPPGSYYATARGKKGSAEYFAYHGANPVKVERDRIWLTFMANEAKPPLVTPGTTTIRGVVTYKGAPVADAHVTLYREGTTTFKGLGYKTEAGGADGRFAVAAPAGVYTVVAKKVQGGKGLRPLAKGDLFCYYPRNPVALAADRDVQVEIPCYPVAERQAFAAGVPVKGPGYTAVDHLAVTDSGIRGHVTDDAGKPLAGMVVLAFSARSLMHHLGERADYSGRTDREGYYFIPVDGEGEFQVVLRSALGQSPGSDDVFLVHKNAPVQLRRGEIVDHVDFVVGGVRDERPAPAERRPAEERARGGH